MAPVYGPEVNLEELRGRLAGQFVLLIAGMSVLLMIYTFRLWPFPLLTFVVLLALLIVAVTAHSLVGEHPAVARHLAVWGTLAALMVALVLYVEIWIPFLGILVTVVAALLVSRGEFFVVGVVSGWSILLALTQGREYPLVHVGLVLITGAAISWLMVRSLYTALEWAWEMQQRADGLLEVSRDRQGELARALRSLEITDAILRRTQRELVVARREADQSRRLKEQFAANVSHELRTPLNLILGFSEVIALSPEVYGKMEWPPTLRQDVYQIYSSSRHLLDMIDDVLDLSRFEMVGFALRKEETALAPLILEGVEIARDLFREQPVSVQVEIADDLPALDIDRTRIRQVLLNLLSNAARFTDRLDVRTCLQAIAVA